MSRSTSPAPLIPCCPNGLFNFDEQCTVVTDADEEILELYMALANTSPDVSTAHGPGKASDLDSGGLGFLDSSKTLLEFSWDLSPSTTPELPPNPTTAFLATSSPMSGTSNGNGARKRRPTRRKEDRSIHVEVNLQQDLNMLKATRGDTGSVLWRSSYYLAEHLLTQHHFQPVASALPLLDPAHLSEARILELGAGTGLLAILLRRLCLSYTASDRWENLKLIKRNLLLNDVGSAGLETRSSPNATKDKSKHLGRTDKDAQTMGGGNEVLLEEIDWVAVSQDRQRRLAQSPMIPNISPQPYDLVLCVDCIFNEHLIQPLVDTLAQYCPRGGKTVVWIVAELRSSEVMTRFLESWLADSSGPWTVTRLSPDAMGRWDGRKPRWVGWVGWR